MGHINYNKFRFRVGDIVTYRGHEYPIVGYFFFFGFNRYNNYGYTLGNFSNGHSGIGCEYNEFGTPITNRDLLWNVNEHYVKDSKVKTKKKD
jgi:hypothetical protein|nr:MAG TPA: hypothetical protein [Crassvirales sp.]